MPSKKVSQKAKPKSRRVLSNNKKISKCNYLTFSANSSVAVAQANNNNLPDVQMAEAT